MANKTRLTPEADEAREPTICEKRELAARSGDIDSLWNELTTRHYSLIDQEELFGHLLRALEVRSRRDPEAFAGDTFARMIGFVSYLTLRSTFYVNARIARYGRATQGNGPAAFPPDVAEKLIPRLIDLQGHLAELIQGQATTARQWELIHAKRAENGRGVGGDVKANRARRSPKAPASANGHTKPPEAIGAKPRKASGKDRANDKSNDHREPAILDTGPINRIGKFLNGDGAGDNGVGHDD
ncbi:MAG: hypothetical protein ABI353_07315 [Isosphaeraceae bacterium]